MWPTGRSNHVRWVTMASSRNAHHSSLPPGGADLNSYAPVPGASLHARQSRQQQAQVVDKGWCQRTRTYCTCTAAHRLQSPRKRTTHLQISLFPSQRPAPLFTYIRAQHHASSDMSAVPSSDGRLTAADLETVCQGLLKLCPFTRSLDPGSIELTIDGGRVLLTRLDPNESQVEDPESPSAQLEQILPRFLSGGNTDDRRDREAKLLGAISVLKYCEDVFHAKSEDGAQAEAGHAAQDEFSQSELIQHLVGWPIAYIVRRRTGIGTPCAF
jgi:hypothetical protein